MAETLSESPSETQNLSPKLQKAVNDSLSNNLQRALKAINEIRKKTRYSVPLGVNPVAASDAKSSVK